MIWRESFTPLRDRNFAWYYAARFASMLGSMMVSVALAFAVLEITDSATALGLVLAAHTIPMVIFLLFGGVIADRFPRTLIMQVSGLLTALTQGAVAFLVITGTAELWMVIALEAVNGMVSTVSFPAMAGIVPQLVPREQLQQANVLLSMSRGGSPSSAPPSRRCWWWAWVQDGRSRSTPARGCLRPRSSRAWRCRRESRGRQTILRPAWFTSSAKAGRCSPATPGYGSSWSPSPCSTRSTPARGSPWGRRWRKTPSARRAGATCSPRSRWASC